VSDDAKVGCAGRLFRKLAAEKENAKAM